jgi:hypothetical protein
LNRLRRSRRLTGRLRRPRRLHHGTLALRRWGGRNGRRRRTNRLGGLGCRGRGRIRCRWGCLHGFRGRCGSRSYRWGSFQGRDGRTLLGGSGRHNRGRRRSSRLRRNKLVTWTGRRLRDGWMHDSRFLFVRMASRGRRRDGRFAFHARRRRAWRRLMHRRGRRLGLGVSSRRSWCLCGLWPLPIVQIHHHARGSRCDRSRRMRWSWRCLGRGWTWSLLYQIEDLVALLGLDRAELVANIQSVLLTQCEQVFALHVELSS